MVGCRKDLMDDRWPLLLGLALVVFSFNALSGWFTDLRQGHLTPDQGGFYLTPLLALAACLWAWRNLRRVFSSICEVQVHDDGTLELNSWLQRNPMPLADLRHIRKIVEYQGFGLRSWILFPALAQGASRQHYEFITKEGVFQVPEMKGLDIVLDLIREKAPTVGLSGTGAAGR